MEWVRNIGLGVWGVCLGALLSSTAWSRESPQYHQVVIEGEHFQVGSGWKVMANGAGNLISDTGPYSHISGERLLHLPPEMEGVATREIDIPHPAAYRVWVRYEYISFSEAAFTLEIIQGEKTLFSQLCATAQSPRFSLGQVKPKSQHDPAEGVEGMVCEAFSVEGLKPGKAKIRLVGKALPKETKKPSPRNIDLVWLTTDKDDSWRNTLGRVNAEDPILDAVRDAVGPRFQARVKNLGNAPTNWSASHTYSRMPWGSSEPDFARNVPPGQWSDWFPLKFQDTSSTTMVAFRAGAPVAFELEIQPVKGGPGSPVKDRTFTLKAKQTARVFLPPYAYGHTPPVGVEDRLKQIIKTLESAPALGKEPTVPLCYGGWLPLGQEDEYGSLYARYYRALGLRSLHPSFSGPKVSENLASVGIRPSKTVAASAFRNFPTTSNIERTKNRLTNTKQNKDLLWFEFGEEIPFSEFLDQIGEEESERARKENQRVTPKDAIASLWRAWLEKRRPGIPQTEYWVGDWGPFFPTKLRPECSPRIAEINPRLFVDSQLFYEEIATAWAVDGSRKVKAAFGQTTLCGYTMSLHPLYWPMASATIRWFRNGGSDFARHSEGFWRTGQAGPLVNGYILEHFRSGLATRPGGIIRATTLPNAPGNTDLDFLRSGYTHLAHGAGVLDFYGIGLNETFGENHIDHRQIGRFLAIRELTHAVGFAEDLLVDSQAVSSGVAILASGSTDRWDAAGITLDRMGLDTAPGQYRKARTHHHLDRLGLWTGLTLLGASPDLILEEDCTPEKLKPYKLVVVVGDCLPRSLAKPLREWVEKGGTLIATAGAGRFDSYREAHADFLPLFGLETRATTTTQALLRPRADLPWAKPEETIKGEGWELFGFATKEQITPLPEATVLARMASDQSPALIARKVGLGRSYYCAFHPGIALMWRALQPPVLNDRGATAHASVTGYDKAAMDLLKAILGEAGVPSLVETSNPLVDRRLIRGSGGDGLLLPLSNYSDQTAPFQVVVRTGFPVRRISSAHHGALTFEKKEDGIHFRHPGLKGGDILRLDP